MNYTEEIEEMSFLQAQVKSPETHKETLGRQSAHKEPAKEPRCIEMATPRFTALCLTQLC